MASPVLLESVAQTFVKSLSIFQFHPFVVGWVHHEQAVFRTGYDVFKALAAHLDFAFQSSFFDVVPYTVDGFKINVRSVNFVLKNHLGKDRFFAHFFPAFFVKILPTHEGKTWPVDLRRNIIRQHGRFDGQGARATHGIDEITVTFPTRKQNHPGSEYLVDGGFHAIHPVATAVQ